MNRLWAGLASTLAILAGQGAAHAGSDASADQQAIVAGEHAWGHAFTTGDVATVEGLLAEDFVGVTSSGATYSKADLLRELRAGPESSADEVGPITVRFYGDTAIAQAQEHEVGLGPTFVPMERVFTDTWVRQAGRWRIVAAEDVDPGAPSPPAFAPAVAEIKAARAANNRAIAAHDMATFTPMFDDDAVFVWSNGTSAAGKDGLTRFFARDFADPAFIAYVREPARVSVSWAGARAVEHGVWTALKHSAEGDTRYGGDYMAHWAKGPQGWRVRGEVYVKLYCQGPLCAP